MASNKRLSNWLALCVVTLFNSVLQAAPLQERIVAPRVNRHALIITISRYADPATVALPGARIDQKSATQMALAMQVPPDNISYLQDEAATGKNLRQAILQLTERVAEGDRVFIHYSGHGTRKSDATTGGCVEALLAHDGDAITNHEMADLLRAITNKTDKLFVMYDACHSGGLAQGASPVRTRELDSGDGNGLLRPKSASISLECGRPVNIKTRQLVDEVTVQGGLSQDIIHVAASRNDEVSFDDEKKGGLATQFLRDCMLRDAQDLDNSGAITMDEIRQCAQKKINDRLLNDPFFKPHNLVLRGNAAFVPAWFAQSSAASASSTSAATAAPAPLAAVASQASAASQLAPNVAAAGAAGMSGEQALLQMFNQRDAKRRVQVSVDKPRLKIGRDALQMGIRSDRAGYVYVALAGSDNQSLYVLFPNALDSNNRIAANQTLELPRSNWRVRVSGPAGTDHVLVVVADAPRDLRSLTSLSAGPFVGSLNDAQGRANLGSLMSVSQAGASAGCVQRLAGVKGPLCSDAYGAAMLSVQEIE